jgi:hypothetical protein
MQGLLGRREDLFILSILEQQLLQLLPIKGSHFSVRMKSPLREAGGASVGTEEAMVTMNIS